MAVGSGPTIAFDALTYFLATGCLARLPLTTSATALRSGTVLGDIRDGWTQFRRIPWVWVVSLTFCLMNLAQSGTWQILGPELTRWISGEATGGFVLSARDLGLLVMSALGALPLLALGARLHTPWRIVSAFAAGRTGQQQYRGDRFSRSAQEPGSGSRRLHAGRHPGSQQTPPDLSQSPGLALVSTPLEFITTRHQRFAHARLPGPHLTRSTSRLSPQRSPRTALNRRSLRWFETSPCRATPEDLLPSLTQHRIRKLLHRRLLQRS